MTAGICESLLAMTRLSAAFGRLFNAARHCGGADPAGAWWSLVTADIVLRNTVRSGSAWANEVSEYSLYLMTLLTAPWLLRRGQHVRLDIILTLVPAARRLADGGGRRPARLRRRASCSSATASR